MTDTRELVQARLAADKVRGEYLTLINQGLMTPAEVIWWATQPGKEPLRALTVKRLMGAIPGNGQVTVTRFTRELADVAGSHTPPSRLTVAWLIDRRAGGRRLIAFANLVAAHHKPWPGFPHAPKPGGAR